ncbi:hypothetical protein IID24_00130 [Patescibacteria group bacterium]|nr:hypothetical protein [Patescibacteria group bacterium]
MANISEKDPYKEGVEPRKEDITEETAEKKPQAEQREVRETREVGIEKEKEILKKELERKAAETVLTPELQEEAAKQISQSAALNDQGKVKHLLDLVQAKGVLFALKVAKQMENDYVLDMFHDTLAEDSRYKDFLEQ